MKDTEAAFRWIISILEAKKLPYQIDGGFAARLYGSKRELADIDINIREEDFEQVIPEVREFIIYGPERFVDDTWDVNMMTLEYDGQAIDISGEATIFDETKQQWEHVKTDFADSVMMTAYGMKVPVIRKEALIAYKTKLGRVVDIEDVKALSGE